MFGRNIVNVCLVFERAMWYGAERPKKPSGKQGKGQLTAAEMSRWGLKQKQQQTSSTSVPLQGVPCCFQGQHTWKSKLHCLVVQFILILPTSGKGKGNGCYFTYLPQGGDVCNCWGGLVLRRSAGGRIKACFSTATGWWKPFSQNPFSSHFWAHCVKHSTLHVVSESYSSVLFGIGCSLQKHHMYWTHPPLGRDS